MEVVCLYCTLVCASTVEGQDVHLMMKKKNYDSVCVCAWVCERVCYLLQIKVTLDKF